MKSPFVALFPVLFLHAAGVFGMASVHVDRAGVQTVVSGARLVSTTVDIAFRRVGEDDAGSDTASAVRIVTVGFPPTSFVSNVTARVGNEEFEGRVLALENARQEFDSAAEDGKDAALFEDTGSGFFTLLIALSGSQDTAVVRIEMVGVPTRDDGVFNDFVELPRDAAAVTVDVLFTAGAEASSIEAVTGLTAAEIDQPAGRLTWTGLGTDGGEATLSQKMSRFGYRYALGGPSLALTVGPRGSFLFVFTPTDTGSDTLGATRIPKVSMLVLDTSGSMAGTRISGCIAAAIAVVDALESTDFFNVVRFSSDTIKWRSEPVLASGFNKISARNFIREFYAGGGTNALGALETALDSVRSFARGENGAAVPVIIFVSDGAPNSGSSFLPGVDKLNTDEVMINAVSIGTGANTDLMAGLAERHGGVHLHVADDGIVRGVTTLFDRFASPVVAAPKIEITVNRGGSGVIASTTAGIEHYAFDNVASVFLGRELAIAGAMIGGGGSFQPGDVVTVSLTGVTGSTHGASEPFAVKATATATEDSFSSVQGTALPTVFAVAKIRFLIAGTRDADDTLIARATATAVEAGLITPLTAMVLIAVTAPEQVASPSPSSPPSPSPSPIDDINNSSSSSGGGGSNGNATVNGNSTSTSPSSQPVPTATPIASIAPSALPTMAPGPGTGPGTGTVGPVSNPSHSTGGSASGYSSSAAAAVGPMGPWIWICVTAVAVLAVGVV